MGIIDETTGMSAEQVQAYIDAEMLYGTERGDVFVAHDWEQAQKKADAHRLTIDGMIIASGTVRMSGQKPGRA